VVPTGAAPRPFHKEVVGDKANPAASGGRTGHRGLRQEVLRAARGGEVNQKVDAVSGQVEKTQQRVTENEARIDNVDKSAQAGIGEAKGSASAAMSKAQDAEKAAKAS
jgi:hypothetical protein